jgi:ferrochelatase
MLDAKPGPTPAQGAADAGANWVRPGEGRLAHAPADHPPVRTARTGILLANLGTPDNYDYWSMRPAGNGSRFCS